MNVVFHFRQAQQLFCDRRGNVIFVTQKADRPTPNRGAPMRQQFRRKLFIETTTDIKGPKTFESQVIVWRFKHLLAQDRNDRAIAAVSQDASSLADKPIVVAA